MVSQMINLDDDEIYSECLWTLAYICKSHNEKIQMVLEADFVFFIVNGLNSTLESILAPCIRLACHISSGYNSQTQRLLDENILDLLEKHLQGYNDMILKELYLALSNIAGGSLPQVQFLFNHPIFEKSLRALNHPSFNVRLEASIYIKNFCIVGRPINLAASLIDLNIHGILSQSLTESDTNYLANILEIIKFVLEADTSKKSKTLFEESGCKDLIEKLTTNLNPKVYQQSNEIIESYFLVQEDPELDFKHTTVQTFNLG